MNRVTLGCLLFGLIVGLYFYQNLRPGQEYLAILIPASALGYFLLTRILIAAREGIVATGSAFLVAGLVLFVTFKTLPEPSEPKRFGLACIAALVAFKLMPEHKRRIRSRVKRDVIQGFERKTGERYDSRKHHIDHIWPFARGGSSSADNLRVITKAENLRKSKHKPRVKDWL